MWHEARKQERKIRGMLVDYRKRAERRRDFYEKIKADPTQFLQVHGRQCKIHLDPAIAVAAELPATMMPWQGNNDNFIDRFDVRAHLDFIAEFKSEEPEDPTYEERQINYERYRIIAQNSFLGITEEKFLKQLHLEEQFGYTENEPKKKKTTGGAAIGFNYEDGTGTSHSVQPLVEEEHSDDNSDSDLDVDLSINVSKLDQSQAHEMNRHGRNFGMSSNDFYSFLTHDLEEAESFRLAKEEEHEKALFSGRKSRRERRAHREKRLANRKISPPSYAARESPTLKLDLHDKSESRSPSPENTGKITFITSFGGEEEAPSKPTYADKVKYGRLKRLREHSEERVVFRDSSAFRRSGSRERRRNRPRDRLRRSWSKTKRVRLRRSSSSSRSRSRGRTRSRSRRSRSHSRRSRSRSRRSLSRTKARRNRSRSRSNSRQRSRSSSEEKRRRSAKSYSRSRSPSKSRSGSQSRSRSPSESKKSASSGSSRSGSPVDKRDSPPPPPKILPRYYGRRKSDQSSSELSDSGGEEESKPEEANLTPQNSTVKIGNSGTSTKVAPGSSLSLQERLKRKRQALLNKQFKADKIAEQMKTEREKQEQQTREDELREMALKLRRKQRERRHAYDSDSSDSSSNSDAKSAGSPVENKKSRSPSPKPREYRERDYRSRERDYNKYRGRYRANSRERGDRYSNRSSKSRYDEKREDDRERYYRDDRRRDSYRERERDRDRKEKGGKSLVDY